MKRVWSWSTSAAAASADGYYDVNYVVPPGLWDSEERAKQEAADYFDNLDAAPPVWERYDNPISNRDPWLKADLRYEGNTEVDEVVVVWWMDIEEGLQPPREVTKCWRCGARYKEDPSCGKTVHELLPNRPEVTS